jgi:histidine ammonia-lyase
MEIGKARQIPRVNFEKKMPCLALSKHSNASSARFARMVEPYDKGLSLFLTSLMIDQSI